MAETDKKKDYPELRGGAALEKPTLKRKIVSAIISEEVHDVKDYLIFDVMIPAVKKTLRDLVMNTIDMTFFGRTAGQSGYDGRDDRRGPYVTYNAMARNGGGRDSDRDTRARERATRYADVRHLDRIEFRFKEDAQDVIDFLLDNINEFGYTTVSDFVGAARLETCSIHNKWGWYDIGDPKIIPLSNGKFYISIAKPRPID